MFCVSCNIKKVVFSQGKIQIQKGKKAFITPGPLQRSKMSFLGKTERFAALFDVTYQGNFEGRNVLHIEAAIEEFASSMLLDEGVFKEKLRRVEKDPF
jgi:uncharacterized protein YyaL (SSP411 family)